MTEKLYPIKYMGKVWEESDVNDIFSLFYNSKSSLDADMSVYVGDGMRITLDGEWIEL